MCRPIVGPGGKLGLDGSEGQQRGAEGVLDRGVLQIEVELQPGVLLGQQRYEMSRQRGLAHPRTAETRTQRVPKRGATVDILAG